eukprot:1154751-Pelagomonas_calceolata.AAC.4
MNGMNGKRSNNKWANSRSRRLMTSALPRTCVATLPSNLNAQVALPDPAIVHFVAITQTKDQDNATKQKQVFLRKAHPDQLIQPSHDLHNPRQKSSPKRSLKAIVPILRWTCPARPCFTTW